MNEPIQDLAPRISDCLKVIYGMQERGQKVSTSAVSKQLGTSDATVTMLFKDFAAAGWVEHVPYHGVHLTPLGERRAMEVISSTRTQKSCATWGSSACTPGAACRSSNERLSGVPCVCA